jgi:hypothetical protein
MIILVDVSPSIRINYTLEKLGLYDTTNSTVIGFDIEVCFNKQPSVPLIFDDLLHSSTNGGTIIQNALDNIIDKNDELVIITDGDTEAMDLSAFRNVIIHSSDKYPHIKNHSIETLEVDLYE